MAPILTTTTGVTPQVLDDFNLRQLLKTLNAQSIVGKKATPVSADQPVPLEIEDLCNTLLPWHKEWLFEEQVDLHEWIHTLNLMDAALTWIVHNYGCNILLVDPVHRSNGEDLSGSPAISLNQIQECPMLVLHYLSVILQFTAALLRNSISKSLYSSVPIISDLLGAADDNIADSAVSVLAALSLPPALHKQQAPEHSVHTTALHQATNGTEIYNRLSATARAWGSRAVGLGLLATVTADDSVHGQGGLPVAIGQVCFCYYKRDTKSSDDTYLQDTNGTRSTLEELNISLQEMFKEQSENSSMSDGSMNNMEETEFEASNKRRRVSCFSASKEAKSTAELFFLALEKAAGKENIPSDRLYSLLSDIRLARCFHSQATRIEAVQRRLLALIALLHAHPPNEVMNGYFQAHPELAVEVVELLKPTVSVANVSSVLLSAKNSTRPRLQPDPVASLVTSTTQDVPHHIRILALEVLTALVSLRDRSTSMMAGSSRLSNVLTELGVGKGQFLGLLPTLIRYSLAAINIPTSEPLENASTTEMIAQDDLELIEYAPDTAESGLDIGLAFAEVTMALPLDRRIQLERALVLIDNVLTLTSAVVGTPNGAFALVDCGLIPAILSTISIDSDKVLCSLLHGEFPCSRLKAFFRFVTAQAVQILEGAIVSHNNGLTIFRDLHGIETLIHRLHREIFPKTRSPSPMQTGATTVEKNINRNFPEETVDDKLLEAPHIVSSQRVVLFSLVTCLTVVFHQDSSTTTSTSGGSQLRQKELTECVIKILDEVHSYGGHLASLIATLLSDVMNSDPTIVHYIHESGIAKAFLKMVHGRTLEDGTFLPTVPPVPELVMAIPSVISALSLTDDGAKAVQEDNPFPSFLQIFYHPNYAMPKSRCLLNEMTAVAGTGLDEIASHVERLKPYIIAAIADALSRVVTFAEEIFVKENSIYGLSMQFVEDCNLEDERSCLIQYVLNFGQLLEQILNNGENCDLFVEAGGFDSLLKLLPSSMPPDSQFLAYLSCLSSPSVSTLHHSTTEETLSQAFKCIEVRYDPLKLIQKLMEVASRHIDTFEQNRKLLLIGNCQHSLVLDTLPRLSLLEISDTKQLKLISDFLRSAATMHWITTVLANAIKSVCQRNSEAGPGWSRNDLEWKKELSSQEFENLVNRLSKCYRESLFEVCKVRTEPDFEELEAVRAKTRPSNLCFRLRIVSVEGAVVRDGIEIDSCANVGSMEMGEIVVAFDRCINSSGILRYRTSRGWVSEMTRGHGREPIAEVIGVYKNPLPTDDMEVSDTSNKRRIEAGISSLRNVTVTVLARGQACCSDLFCSLSKLTIQGVRSLPGRAITFEEGSPGAHVYSLMRIIAANLKQGLSQKITDSLSTTDATISDAGVAMFYGCYFSQLFACLFDDKREGRLVNFTLLVSFLATDPFVISVMSPSDVQLNKYPPSLFDAINFVLNHSLSDFESRSVREKHSTSLEQQQQVARSVAASFPPLLALLRKLITTPFASSPSASIMSRMKWKDVSRLLGDDEIDLTYSLSSSESESFFSPEKFVNDLQCVISNVVKGVWTDARVLFTPSFLLHPLATLADEIIVSLQESKKKSPNPNAPSRQFGVRLSELTRRRREGSTQASNSDDIFEPSEDIINQMMEMGFSRDQALDALESTNSNRIETAMEYALSNPPSPHTLERRRMAREERSRRRSEQVSNSNMVSQENSILDGSISDLLNVTIGRESSGDSGSNSLNQTEETEKRTEKLPITSTQVDLSSWLELIPDVTCKFLCSMRKHKPLVTENDSLNTVTEKDGDAENEALTAILCSLLLDLCHRYPEKRTGIISPILSQLKAKLRNYDTADNFDIFMKRDDEASVAALCHATVFITRALPKMRLLVLKEGLVSSLVTFVKSYVGTLVSRSSDYNNGVLFPLWLAPSLLVLDVMAQPMVAFAEDTLVKTISEENPDADFLCVRSEHENQMSEIVRVANICFGIKKKEGKSNSHTQGTVEYKVLDSNGTMDAEYSDAEGKGSGKPIDATDLQSSPFSCIPAYFPLLSNDNADQCHEICFNLLRACQEENETVFLPPGVTHATMLLLLKLLRTPKIAARCLDLGVADAILSLPKKCSFSGNTGLVTLIFRRLLEDTTTLQVAMETEIRGTVSKLLTKKSPYSNEAKTYVSLPLCMESFTPLLCRNPLVFLKSMALSLRFVNENNETKVSLLSPTDRSLVLEAFNEITNFSTLSNDFDTAKEDVSRFKKTTSALKSKTKLTQKSPKRLSSGSKKTKKDKNDPFKGSNFGTNDSTSTQLTFLIINAIITSSSVEVLDQKDAFLWTGSLLEILADLVLAVPACASAVHNFRFHRNKEKTKKYSPVRCHALVGNVPTPRSFVTFLLHILLPQERWKIRNDSKLWDRRKEEDDESSKATKHRKKSAYRIMRVSQASARVLLALAVRPGEGRKRVISDLVFALSGGTLSQTNGPPNISSIETVDELSNIELEALHSWGELCLGLIAPRSNGKNLDGTSSLCIDNLRIMLEYGMVHALLFAVNRVQLHHAMASSICGSLLLPIEVLTRSSVTDAVKELVAKEATPKDLRGVNEKTHLTVEKGETQSMIEISLDHEAERHNIEDNSIPAFGVLGVSLINHLSAVDSLDGLDDDGENEDEEGSSDEEDSVEDDEEDEDDESDVDMNDEDDHSGMEDEDDDEDDDEDEDDEASSDDVGDEVRWDADYYDRIGASNGPENDDVGDEGTERIDENLEEGWTRIDSNFHYGLWGAPRRGGFSASAERNRGFIDAAETMLGTLIRNGDINRETLAEIEGTLGIRIMSGQRELRAIRATLRPNEISESGIGDSLSLRVFGTDVNREAHRGRTHEIIGTIPHIHQRSQPDVGYSPFGRGQNVEISSMEYVYGGPSVTGGSRNYDVRLSVPEDSDSESQYNLTQLDLHLFPGGPASATSARSQHSSHPLLNGIDLPPMNSLVSDLLPHGVRATRSGHIITRRPGDFSNASFAPGGFLVSTSNGNIIRSGRSHPGYPLGGGIGNRQPTALSGWTDDGLPMDVMMEEFSSAFERSLTAAVGMAVQQEQLASPVQQPSEGTSPPSFNNQQDESAVESIQNPEAVIDATLPADTENAPGTEEHYSLRSDDDQVASSLATGLRLSPEHDDNRQSEDVSNDVHTQVVESSNMEGLSLSPTTMALLSSNIDRGATIESIVENATNNDNLLVSDIQHEQITEGMDLHNVAVTNPISDVEHATHMIEPSHVTSEMQHPSFPNSNGLVCPPDVDQEVFDSLPREMQQDLVEEYNLAQELTDQLDGSTLDRAVLAELPPEMRREIIEQDVRERRLRQQEQALADPSRAQDIDIASLIATLTSPELRSDILRTVEDSVLSTLPPEMQAEAQVLRERASLQQRSRYENALNDLAGNETLRQEVQQTTQNGSIADGSGALNTRRKQRTGKLRVELDRNHVVYIPGNLSSPFAMADVKTFFRLMYLMSPVRPPRLIQKIFHNLCLNPGFRSILSSAFVHLLHDDSNCVNTTIKMMAKEYEESDIWKRSIDSIFSKVDDFPPSVLLGAAFDVPSGESFGSNVSFPLFNRNVEPGTTTSTIMHAKNSGVSIQDSILPPAVAVRLVDTLMNLCKSSPRFCLHVLMAPVLESSSSDVPITCFDKLLELLDKPMYSKSSTNLDQLLNVLESAVSPLSHVSKHVEEDSEISQRDITAATAAGKEWVDIPRISVSQSRLQLLCSVVRLETCRDTGFTKVNTIIRHICKIEANRGFVLAELASVAHALGGDATRDLRALRIRMEAAMVHQKQIVSSATQSEDNPKVDESQSVRSLVSNTVASTVTLSTSTSELKLLRVLQTLHSLCNDAEDQSNKKNEVCLFVTDELVHLLRQMHFDELWDELSACLRLVQVLEGVMSSDDTQSTSEELDANDEASGEETNVQAKKLRNSSAGLLTRFLPSVEAFFVANASATRPPETNVGNETTGQFHDDILDGLVGGRRLVEFVTSNKVLLNALVRNNSSLLDKSLRALVQVPRCRSILDFDVKRQWFKAQMSKLRKQAARRHSSLRLNIRRDHVFEEAYQRLRIRNAEEMRGRLHITYVNEQGVDGGGLSRDFFEILAKEMFNPNYALFTSTEDGCTFQPNPNSSINPDHLSYFRFVGRIVGKAVSDGFYLDAHFTRSLYKHMLGLEPTHHDMEAIDPDYYRNLKSILEFNLADMGLDLTFSIQDNSFGRHQVIDLKPNGRNIVVTEDNKEDYVRKVCQYRMTTSIKSQIQAFLDGFHELVKPELIALFTPRELELLISGLPEIDLDDLKKNTEYVGWKATDKEIGWFWNILESLTRNEKASFLQFVTGSSKVPLSGFSELQGMRGVQKFSIHKATGVKGTLMSAHTCFNSLDLPVYDSEEEMRDRLLYSINEGVGGFMFA